MRSIVVLIILVAAAHVASQVVTAPKRPTTAVQLESCVTADCHANVKRHRVLHGPVNVDGCDACHNPLSIEEHTFELKREPEQLCTFCHQLEIPPDHHVHEPITTGQCTGCHDPHGGSDMRFMKPNAFGQACLTCHEELAFKAQAFVHGPVAAGECGGCHAPHSASREKLLVETGRELCLSCHQETGEQMFAAALVHKPASEDCLTCHDPHATSHAMMTRAPTVQLCTDSCHEDVRAAVSYSQFPHAAATQDAACSNCHSPHSANRTALMKDQPLQLCLKCHDQPMQRDGRPELASIAQLIPPDTHQHGPVSDGSCGTCHNVHGSNVQNLLVAAYPQQLYQPFQLDSYELCFTCHDSQIVEARTLDGLTQFRDGDRNLHYLHVNKAKRGRTCRACHETHAATHQRLIRDTVEYGQSQWELPINFKPTDSGGSCSPGCHQPLRYDRVEPLNDRILPTVPDEKAAPKTTAFGRDRGASPAPVAAESKGLP